MKSPIYYFQNINNYPNHAQLIFEMTTSKALLFTSLTIKIFVTRISLEYRPFFSSSEHRLTYSAVDVGDIYINKSRRKSIVGAHRVNSSEKLFEVKGLTHEEAESFKDALDTMLSYRFSNAPFYQPSYAANGQLTYRSRVRR
jgi:hypothetical protein